MRALDPSWIASNGREDSQIMSILNKTNAANHPSREAVEDHTAEATEETKMHHAAMTGAKKASETIKRNETEHGGLFTK